MRIENEEGDLSEKEKEQKEEAEGKGHQGKQESSTEEQQKRKGERKTGSSGKKQKKMEEEEEKFDIALEHGKLLGEQPKKEKEGSEQQHKKQGERSEYWNEWNESSGSRDRMRLRFRTVRRRPQSPEKQDVQNENNGKSQDTK